MECALKLSHTQRVHQQRTSSSREEGGREDGVLEVGHRRRFNSCCCEERKGRLVPSSHEVATSSHNATKNVSVRIHCKPCGVNHVFCTGLTALRVFVCVCVNIYILYAIITSQKQDEAVLPSRRFWLLRIKLFVGAADVDGAYPVLIE